MSAYADINTALFIALVLEAFIDFLLATADFLYPGTVFCRVVDDESHV